MRKPDWIFLAGELVMRMWCMSRIDRQLNRTITRFTSDQTVLSCVILLDKNFHINKSRADAWLNILSWWTQHQDGLYEQRKSVLEQHKHTSHLRANISVMCICAWLKSSYRNEFVRTLDWTFSAGERIIEMRCMSENDWQLNRTITRSTSEQTVPSCVIVLD